MRSFWSRVRHLCGSRKSRSSTTPDRDSNALLDPGQDLSNSPERSDPPEVTAPSQATDQNTTRDFVNAVYYPNWRIYTGQSPATLNLENVTHVFYAFAKLEGDGTVILSDEHGDLEIDVDGTQGCIKAFQKVQKEKYPSMKLILSIGGGADSKNFAKATADMIGLERLGRTARKLVDDLGMDGIDIDWEHPEDAAQGRQYSNLLSHLRLMMPAPLYIVTTAIPAGLWALKNMDLGEISEYVDMINLMAYDFVGPFPGITKSGHHAQLRCRGEAGDGSAAAPSSGEAAMQHLLKQGVTRDKIVLGVPLYGISFLGASGPGQEFSGHGGEAGFFECRHLPTSHRLHNADSDNAHVDAITPCAEQFDSALTAAWCVGPDTVEGGGFISYDNAMSVEAKARFVREEALGGMFYWHIGYDKPPNEGSLVDVGAKVLWQAATEK